MLLKNQT